MTTIRLKGIDKSYTPGVKALDAVDLTIESGEFFTLLGPSGCGKTTLLRTVAGFVAQENGQIFFDGDRIDHIPAYRRDTGMVFQDFAIFPHMSVADNVAFGLHNRKVAREEIKERVGTSLEMARLSGLGNRMPDQLSGGQQQRVGLARAMVVRPKVLLMDEPLSNLDAKLRIELREDIRDIQKRLGITTIYVTHDQEEALVISDRVCILENGVVQQVGRPWDVYKDPETHSVAAFVGTMNFIDARMEKGTGGNPATISFAGHEIACQVAPCSSSAVTVAIRPEDVAIADDHADDSDGVSHLVGTVRKISFTGREAKYALECEGGISLTVNVARPTLERLTDTGGKLKIALPHESLLFFDNETQRRL